MEHNFLHCGYTEIELLIILAYVHPGSGAYCSSIDQRLHVRKNLDLHKPTLLNLEVLLVE